MSDITIVTAFFDIGRSEWTPDKGLPHYLHRTTKTYLERFAHMADLDNPMVIFTSKEFAKEIQFIRQNKPTDILIVDFKNNFTKLRNEIQRVQSDPKFQSKINPMQVKNPEYWSADYVLVNMLKASFVNQAIKTNLIKTDLIAWLDFGYCRDKSTLNDVKNWRYSFDKNKIHFFNLKDWKEGTYIEDVIFNNDVHITGPCIVAGKEMWQLLEGLIHHNLDELFKNNLVDDDQTLLLMSYLQKPDAFELHKVNQDDWFIVFKDYNVNTD